MLPQWFGHALKYLGDLVVFAAALAAVLGETRFQNRQGLRSITKSGWAAMALVVGGLLMSSLGTWLTARRQTLIAKRRKLRGVAGAVDIS
jgi:branched-subunit amino acid transport protein